MLRFYFALLLFLNNTQTKRRNVTLVEFGYEGTTEDVCRYSTAIFFLSLSLSLSFFVRIRPRLTNE